MRVARAAVVSFLIEIAAVLALGAIVFALPYNGSLGGVETGALALQRMLLRLFTLRTLIVAMWWLRLPLHILALAFFMAWTYATHKSLNATRMASHWAITGWFVPLWNYVAPYLVIRDIFRASARGEEESAVPLVVKVWWTAVVLQAIAATTAFALAFAGVLAPHILELDRLAIADYALESFVAALFVAVIVSVETRFAGAPLKLTSAVATAAVLVVAFSGAAFGFYQMHGGAVRDRLMTGGVGLEEVIRMGAPQKMLAELTPAKPKQPRTEEPPPEPIHSEPLAKAEAIAELPVTETEPPLPVSPPPRLLKKVEPTYIEAARRAHIYGVVLVQVVVDREGNVKDVRIVRGLPYLERATTDAVMQWKFEPTRVHGKPVEVTFPTTVRFELPH